MDFWPSILSSPWQLRKQYMTPALVRPQTGFGAGRPVFGSFPPWGRKLGAKFTRCVASGEGGTGELEEDRRTQ